MPKTVRKSPEASPASKAKPIHKRAKAASLSIAYPNACGIDIGATSHFVAVPADRDAEPVQEFAAFTADLEHLVRWLRQCAITAVAMPPGLKSTWLTRATSGVCLDARATCWTVSGCSN
jgi:hypothetical protein